MPDIYDLRIIKTCWHMYNYICMWSTNFKITMFSFWMQFFSILDIFIGICERGTFLSREKDECQQCQIGSYQPFTDRYGCKLCPPGTSTANPGAVLESQCVPGTINRCTSELAHCDLDKTECVPTDTWYYCRCKPGMEGDGVICTSELAYSPISKGLHRNPLLIFTDNFVEP